MNFRKRLNMLLPVASDHSPTQNGGFGRWQGRQGSNLRPSVLETDALPTELLPYRDVEKIQETNYFVSLCNVCLRSHLQYLRTSIRSVFNFLLREVV